MRRNTIVNLGFILANFALLVLLQLPHGMAAMVDDVPRTQTPIVSNSSRYWEIVVPLEPRPVQKEEHIDQVVEPTQPLLEDDEGEADPVTPAKAQAKVYRNLPTGDKVIALTFDDGPKGSVKELLAILRENDVPATFFLLGCNALNRPDLVQEIIDAGCDIANHTWSHPYLTELTEEKLYWQVETCTAAFRDMGVDYQPFMRPPYGKWDDRVLETCAALDYRVLIWSVDSRDWEFDDPQVVLKKALAGLKPGSIILFHDGPKVTLKVLPQFIEEARAQGYQFVLISDYIQ